MNWIILLAPLASAGLITFALLPFRRGSVAASIAACGVSFVAAVLVFLNPEGHGFGAVPWLRAGGLHITLGGISDPLSRIMLLVVTGVGLLIHIFAYGYMKDDPNLSRFYAKLSFFMFSMLGIVLADNLVMMFIFWELVGLASYLLIGFWFQRPSAAEASKKAFIVNRLGDFGFMIGILTVWAIFGAVDFSTLTQKVAILSDAGVESSQVGSWIGLAALGLFLGCVGKSAQFPLHVWLPDAMEGPTPVSALIHAATMVAAGVYMLCRVFFILELSPIALHVISWTGAITAIFAALIALQQNDIKRILAYSTLSQLGYMVAAVGLASTTAAMFHLATHAFFKALLFLGAGSVIHALHHEQNIWAMGGLRKKLPITFATFAIGTLALTGFPFLFSGFYSKEEILLVAYGADPLIFVILLATAALTSFYMFRLLIVAFLGKARGESVAHAHESPAVMWVPLVLLALLSIGGGWLGIARYVNEGEPLVHGPGSGLVMGLSIAAFAGAAVLAWFFYNGRDEDPISITVLKNKFYSDEIYQAVFVNGQQAIARGLDWVDTWIVGGLLVRGTAALGTFGGELLRLLQGGNLQAYVVLFILGVVFLCYWILIRPFA
jgi:NADH-quinone oxidoreductase subunit L